MRAWQVLIQNGSFLMTLHQGNLHNIKDAKLYSIDPQKPLGVIDVLL